jgi:hypothetical protein
VLYSSKEFCSERWNEFGLSHVLHIPGNHFASEKKRAADNSAQNLSLRFLKNA